MDRSWSAPVYGAMLTLAIAACSGPAGAVVPSPTAAPLPTAAPPPTAPPVAKLSTEQLWTSLFGGDPDQTVYPSMASMAADSDLIVLGSFKDVRPGPNSVAGPGLENYMFTVDVSVEQVLLGDPSLEGAVVPVAVFVGVDSPDSDAFAGDIAQHAESVPPEHGVLFLQNIVEFYSRFDPSAAKRHDPTAYQVASLQGMVRDNAGVVWVPAAAPGGWPAALSGKPFSAILEAAAAASAASRP